LAEGGELFDEIERRKYLTEEDAADVISQLLSAIIYCHERRIVHRDLKPENILLENRLTDKMRIKVIDFGTANAFDPLKTTTGTAYYMAPEVLMKDYNEKCDVWSCGVILYILLSGMPPFNGKDDAEILKAVECTKFSC
jgi:calcium-dependent protein kinase